MTLIQWLHFLPKKSSLPRPGDWTQLLHFISFIFLENASPWRCSILHILHIDLTEILKSVRSISVIPHVKQPENHRMWSDYIRRVRCTKPTENDKRIVIGFGQRTLWRTWTGGDSLSTPHQNFRVSGEPVSGRYLLSFSWTQAKVSKNWGCVRKKTV